MMTLAQDRGDIAHGLVHERRVARGNVDVVHVNHVHEPVHCRGNRNEDLVVVILADGVYAFFLEHADDFEGNVIDPYRLADGFPVFEEIADNGLAEHGHPKGGRDLFVGEEAAQERPEIPDIGKIRGRAGNYRVGACLAVLYEIFSALERGHGRY